MSEVLNIDKFMGKVKPRIYRVGIELEGGWEKEPEGEHIHHDGSVQLQINTNRNGNARVPQWALDRNGLYYRVDPITGDRDPTQDRGFTERQATAWNDNIRYGAPRAQIGEIASAVLDLASWKGWMEKCYPQHVNHTCGLHVHMSFRKAIHYERLMIPEYQSTILTYLSKWALSEGVRKDHPIWDRLAGKNEFCKHEFHADAQVTRKKDYNYRTGVGNRYTAINYCYNEHNTLECRVLPMMETCEQSVRAVQQVLDITNACLRLVAKKEKAVSADFVTKSLNDTRKLELEKVLEREVSRHRSNS